MRYKELELSRSQHRNGKYWLLTKLMCFSRVFGLDSWHPQIGHSVTAPSKGVVSSSTLATGGSKLSVNWEVLARRSFRLGDSRSSDRWDREGELWQLVLLFHFLSIEEELPSQRSSSLLKKTPLRQLYVS